MPANVRRACRDTLKVIAPGMTPCQRSWLRAAEIFRVGHLISRKIRVLKNPKNHIPYAFGAGLEALTGNMPTVQGIAKATFGALSVMRCSEDLIEITRLSQRCRQLFRGTGYIVVKKDNWKAEDYKRGSPAFIDGWRWFRYVYLAQIKLAFQTIGAIFKRLLLLALHLSDVYAAFRYNHVAEVFVYGKELWKSLSSDKSRLAQELTKAKQVADSMLIRTGSSWTVSFLLTIVTVPIKIKQKLPNPRDVEISFAKMMQGMEERMEASEEFYRSLERSHFHRRVMGRSYVPPAEKKYRVFKKGGEEDADLRRFIKPPVKKMGIPSTQKPVAYRTIQS
jgi:hypothetical protein